MDEVFFIATYTRSSLDSENVIIVQWQFLKKSEQELAVVTFPLRIPCYV